MSTTDRKDPNQINDGKSTDPPLQRSITGDSLRLNLTSLTPLDERPKNSSKDTLVKLKAPRRDSDADRLRGFGHATMNLFARFRDRSTSMGAMDDERSLRKHKRGSREETPLTVLATPRFASSKTTNKKTEQKEKSKQEETPDKSLLSSSEPVPVPNSVLELQNATAQFRPNTSGGRLETKRLEPLNFLKQTLRTRLRKMPSENSLSSDEMKEAVRLDRERLKKEKEDKKKTKDDKKKKNNPNDPTTAVPALVEECISYLETKALHVVGITRVSGSTVQIKLLKKFYDKGKPVHMDKITDPHTVAGLLKCYLREEPECLLTIKLYDEWMKAADLPEDQQVARIIELVEQLPASNQVVLDRLLQYLAKVDANRAVNKMDCLNLATMFGPNLLRSPEDTPEKMLRDQGGVNRVVQSLIKDYSKIFKKDVQLPAATTTESTTGTEPDKEIEKTETHATVELREHKTTRSASFRKSRRSQVSSDRSKSSGSSHHKKRHHRQSTREKEGEKKESTPEQIERKRRHRRKKTHDKDKDASSKDTIRSKHKSHRRREKKSTEGDGTVTGLKIATEIMDLPELSPKEVKPASSLYVHNKALTEDLITSHSEQKIEDQNETNATAQPVQPDLTGLKETPKDSKLEEVETDTNTSQTQPSSQPQTSTESATTASNLQGEDYSTDSESVEGEPNRSASYSESSEMEEEKPATPELTEILSPTFTLVPKVFAKAAEHLSQRKDLFQNMFTQTVDESVLQHMLSQGDDINCSASGSDNVAGLLMHYLKSLDPPLISLPGDGMSDLLAALEIEDPQLRTWCARGIIDEALEPGRLQTLHMLFLLLSNISKQSNRSSESLATIFAPLLLGNSFSSELAAKQTKAVSVLIGDCNFLFGPKED